MMVLVGSITVPLAVRMTGGLLWPFLVAAPAGPAWTSRAEAGFVAK